MNARLARSGLGTMRIVVGLSILSVGNLQAQTTASPQNDVQPAARVQEGPSDADATKAIAKDIEALRAGRFTDRDAATDRLMRLDADSREAIEAALARENDPEVAVRLAHVAVHLYLKGQTRFVGQTSILGISLSTETASTITPDEISADASAKNDRRVTWQTAVTIEDVLPGFPAAEVLKPGDRVVAIAGRPFTIDTTILDFRRMVAFVRPGQSLALTLIRNGKILDVSVKVAAVDESIEPLEDYRERRLSAAVAYQMRLDMPAMGKPLLLARVGQ